MFVHGRPDTATAPHTWRAHTPGIHSPAPRTAAQMAGLARKRQYAVSVPSPNSRPLKCSSPPCRRSTRNEMECRHLPQYPCRNPPEALGSSCKDKRTAPAGRHLLQTTTSSGTTTALFSLSPPPSFPFALPSFQNIYTFHTLLSLALFLPCLPLSHPTTHTHTDTQRKETLLECNLTLLHETPQLIPMIQEDQALSNECPHDMLTLSPSASPSIRHKLASTHPKGDRRFALIFTM